MGKKRGFISATDSFNLCGAQNQVRQFRTSSPCLERKRMTGVVVTNGAQKSVVVAVERYFVHPKVGMMIKKRKKFMAHDEEDKYQIGDRVIIEEHRPISKRKRFIVIGLAPSKIPSYLREEDKQEIDAKFSKEHVESESESAKQLSDK
mmetsp:Transcript_38860/g.122471  ORF Transcript_38860/g.122471 Transcript_38860/m.122471 type:complete len:148 (-) Transcript_38860:1197-1640(-)